MSDVSKLARQAEETLAPLPESPVKGPVTEKTPLLTPGSPRKLSAAARLNLLQIPVEESIHSDQSTGDQQIP